MHNAMFLKGLFDCWKSWKDPVAVNGREGKSKKWAKKIGEEKSRTERIIKKK